MAGRNATARHGRLTDRNKRIRIVLDGLRHAIAGIPPEAADVPEAWCAIRVAMDRLFDCLARWRVTHTWEDVEAADDAWEDAVRAWHNAALSGLAGSGREPSCRQT